jgi:hypothetical protein
MRWIVMGLIIVIVAALVSVLEMSRRNGRDQDPW